MSGFVAPEIPANRMAGEVGFDTPASFGEGWAAAFSESWATALGPSGVRRLQRDLYRDRSFAVGPGERMTMPAIPSKILSAADANARYGVKGHLAFDADTPEPVAMSLRKRTDGNLMNLDAMRRAESGIGTMLTAGLAASVLDPVSVGLAFVPVVGQTRYAAWAASMGKQSARAAKGALEGAVGAALAEPVIWSVAQEEQIDYTAVDSLMNLAFGSAIGAGLHLGVGHLNDRFKARETATPLQRTIDDLPRQDQEALLRTAVAAIETGRPVDVAPVLAVAEAGQERRVTAELHTYAAEMRGSPAIVDVWLVGSTAARGEGRDIDVLYDLGARELPDDPGAAAAKIEDIIETETTINTERFDSFFKVGDRYFHLSSGAGRGIVENTDYAGQQAGKPRVRLGAEEAAEPVARSRPPMTPDEEFARNREIRKTVEDAMIRRARTEPMADELAPAQAAARAAEAREPTPKPLADRVAEIESEIVELERFAPDGELEAIKTASAAELKYAATYEKALKIAATCRMRRS